MVIILIRRFLRPDKEEEFLAAYRARKPIDNPKFRGETLTRVGSAPDIPPGLRSLALNGPACVTYLNVSKWESWEAFAQQFDITGAGFDPDMETAPRQRMVLDVMAETPSVAPPADEESDSRDLSTSDDKDELSLEAFAAVAAQADVRIELENLTIMREGYLGLKDILARMPQAPDFSTEPALVFAPAAPATP